MPHLTSVDQTALLHTLEERFVKNPQRHPHLEWASVEAVLKANPEKLRSLQEMERTGGQPDVVGQDQKTGAVLFYDCSPESPAGRRNTCYDKAGQLAREKKGIHPAGSALGMAEEMGVALLTEEEYRHLQELGEFDLKTSSWIYTPEDVHQLGGALFCDRRYNQVFVYHNSTPSFYSARGFRGKIAI